MAEHSELPAPLSKRSGWPWAESHRPVHPDRETVSVVTPSFRQGVFIEETIRSVLLQGQHVEHIVIDGGSTDSTLDVLRHYDAHITWVSEPDAGQADAINKGLRIAGGSILSYLNADDTYLRGAVSAIAKCFRESPGVGLVYGDCAVVESDGRAIGMLRGSRTLDAAGMIRRGDFIPQQTAFWRRSVMEAVGEFDASLRYCMDHDFFIRAVQTVPARYVEETLATFRLHDSSKTVSQSEAHWREAIAVSRRHGMTPWTLAYWVRHLRHYGGRALPGVFHPAIARRTMRIERTLTSLER